MEVTLKKFATSSGTEYLLTETKECTRANYTTKRKLYRNNPTVDGKDNFVPEREKEVVDYFKEINNGKEYAYTGESGIYRYVYTKKNQRVFESFVHKIGKRPDYIGIAKSQKQPVANVVRSGDKWFLGKFDLSFKTYRLRSQDLQLSPMMKRVFKLIGLSIRK